MTDDDIYLLMNMHVLIDLLTGPDRYRGMCMPDPETNISLRAGAKMTLTLNT
jgi:hypothetical protein